MKLWGYVSALSVALFLLHNTRKHGESPPGPTLHAINASYTYLPLPRAPPATIVFTNPTNARLRLLRPLQSLRSCRFSFKKLKTAINRFSFLVGKIILVQFLSLCFVNSSSFLFRRFEVPVLLQVVLLGFD